MELYPPSQPAKARKTVDAYTETLNGKDQLTYDLTVKTNFSCVNTVGSNPTPKLPYTKYNGNVK